MDKSAWSTTHSVPPPSSRRRYKPFILRIPSLLFVCFLSIALIVTLEYASRKLPHADKGHRTLDTIQSKVSSILDKRQATSTPTSQTTIKTSATNPDAYVTTESRTTLATKPSAYVDTDRQSTATTDDYVSPTFTLSATAIDGYVPTETKVTVFATTSNGYVRTMTTTQVGPVTKPVFSTTGGYVSTGVTILATPLATPPSGYVASIKTFSITEIGSTTSSITTTDAEGRPTIFATVIPYTTMREVATAVPSHDEKGPRVITLTWPLWKVFVGGYLPVFLAILYKLFWTAIYAKVKLIEPFTRMARPQGAVAADTLHTYYLSSNLMPDPLVSFFKGHWLIFWTSFVYLVVGVLAPLASEVVFLDTNYQCANPNLEQDMNPCWPPKLSVDPLIVRMLQGFLAYIAVMTLVLTWMLFHSSTGLYANPSSIGSVASLLHHPEVLEDFRQLDDEIILQDIRKQLGDKRYRLQDYQRPDGAWRYGFVPVASGISYGWKEKGPTKSPRGYSEGAKKQRIFDLTFDISFAVLLVGLLVVIVVYFKDSSDSAFNRFFNSNAFGPRFFMTAMGSIIVTNFKRLERDAHTLTPYYRLAQSPSPARTTILVERRSLPFSAFFAMLYHRHFFAASFAIIAILAEILVITLASVPYSPGQIYLELLVCSYTSMGVLALMIMAIIALVLWRRNIPDLPRAPDTILGVMSYLADSRMLDDFEGCEILSSKEVDNRINGLGKRYGYGRFVGVDGRTKWMVDEENIVVT